MAFRRCKGDLSRDEAWGRPASQRCLVILFRRETERLERASSLNGFDRWLTEGEKGGVVKGEFV